MFNTQAQLFLEEDSLLQPSRNLINESKDERIAIENATHFACDLLLHCLMSDGELILPIEEFIEILTEKFGYGVRLYLFDVAKNLRVYEALGNYAKTHLTVEALQNALRGKEEKERAKDESTLDELFA